MPAITVEQALHLAIAQTRAGQLLEAEAACRKIVAAQPGHAAAWVQLGEICSRLGRTKDAVTAFERAVSIEPGRPEIHYNLGNAYAKIAEWDKAAACYQRALALKPDYSKAHNNLGYVFLEQNRPEDALAQFQWQADGPDRHYNLGVALAALARWEDAIASHRRAIALKPDHADAHWALASGLLVLGRYEEGWQAQARREKCPERVAARRPFRAPAWDGSRAIGETILLYEEQGYGDAIQFLRYVPFVRERSGAARVIVACQPPLSRLLKQSGVFGADVVDQDTAGATLRFDRQSSFLDLPFALQRWEPLPAAEPYLRADSASRAVWRERLGARSRFRVGLAWAGDPRHPNDRSRSISPEKLLPILREAPAEFYSLQILREGGEPQPLLDAGLLDLTESIADFADTAALVAELDLVISIDTAVAHLAGALGKPVWTLLPFVPDWRWGLKREDTPWYPTMRLFRQPAPGGWDSVICRVAGEISALAARRG